MRPDILTPLFVTLENFKGIGDKTAKLYARLGLTRAVDVLWHLPVDLIHRPVTSIQGARAGEYATVKVEILNHHKAAVKRSVYKVSCTDGRDRMTLQFFNAHGDYISKSLPVGTTRWVSGRIESWRGEKAMTHPDYIAANADEIPLHEPVYPLTAGVSNKMMGILARRIAGHIPPLPEWQDDPIGFVDAVRSLHNPHDVGDVLPVCPARRRLAYDELLANQLTIALARRHMRRLPGRAVDGDGGLRARVRMALPFKLTAGQSAALDEIHSDQRSGARMLRLLQGDVGSGKTVVALFAALNAIECGRQAAFMAPTDLLARQHYATLTKMARDVRIALLTGREKGRARTETLDALAAGGIDLIVGTHALFQDDVTFKDLSLAVIDEQHRFGVEQRMRLSSKGMNPDILLMTATPIPRSLALTGYGDMDMSVIREKPANRRPVKTSVMSVDRVFRIMDSLPKALADGEQVYWLCPLIEESEKSDLTAAGQRFEELSERFPGDVGLIHGRMKTPDREQVMDDFAAGRLKILVSTTVIEVGVDVPEATIMIIERAERFGLAQLHQLRGRVGRGRKASNCLLLYGTPLSPMAKERLAVIRTSDDGFAIAEKDLEMRGAGELLGTRQSGLADFKIADIVLHKDLLLKAVKDVRALMRDDPYLQSPRGNHIRTLLYLFDRDSAIRTLQSG